MSVLRTGWATHVGLTRRNNEDALFAGRRVWVVADGMGGHAAGEVASRLAVETLAGLDVLDASLTRHQVLGAVTDANEALLAYGDAHPGSRGLGTTLAGVVAVADADGAERLCVFNIGDSRVYRVHDDHLERITVDHSEVEELVADGVITLEQARRHPLRNIVTRSLGQPRSPQTDSWLLDPAETRRLLICSDGLSGEVSAGVLLRVLTDHPDPQEAADALVAAALRAGGRDNVTVVVLDVAPAG